MDSIASQEVLTIGYNRQTQQDNVSRGSSCHCDNKRRRCSKPTFWKL